MLGVPRGVGIESVLVGDREYGREAVVYIRGGQLDFPYPAIIEPAYAWSGSDAPTQPWRQFGTSNDRSREQLVVLSASKWALFIDNKGSVIRVDFTAGKLRHRLVEQRELAAFIYERALHRDSIPALRWGVNALQSMPVRTLTVSGKTVNIVDELRTRLAERDKTKKKP